MDDDASKVLMEIKRAVLGQTQALMMLVEQHGVTSRLQVGLLEQILAAVTEPVPASPVADLLETVIALQRDTIVQVQRVDHTVARIETLIREDSDAAL